MQQDPISKVKNKTKKKKQGRVWWHTALIPALRKQGQVDRCEFETKLVYIVGPRTARDT